VLTGTPAGTDLYEVLGVDAAVSGDEIARAFRSRAKQLHPDTSADPDAAGRFAELAAAYGVLSNHRTRREYDHARRAPPHGGGLDARRGDGTATSVVAPKRWTRRRAWTALVAGVLVTLLGVGAALLTGKLHDDDARRRARFRPVTAVRTGDGDITFLTADGRPVRTREPQQHGEGSDAGSTVGVRYDPSDPTHVIVDANTLGRDITLAIVALKLLIGGPVFVVLGARRLRAARAPTPKSATTGAR
jgi:curved DNA-binding protein CbpA